MNKCYIAADLVLTLYRPIHVAMLLVESALVLEQIDIPVWLLPYHSSHDVVSLLHRLYPAYMNGCRCIIGAFVVDHKTRRLEAMQELSDATRAVTMKSVSVVQSAASAIRAAESQTIAANGTKAASSEVGSSSMVDYLRAHKSASANSAIDMVKTKAALVADRHALQKKEKASSADYSWLRNLAIYIAARYLLVKTPAAAK
jgi:hypothetical protein